MPQYGEPEKQADEQGPDAERAPARGARARGAMPARPGVRSDAVRAIGVPIGRELPASELPMPLRIGLRIGIGVSLFVILATLRQCRAFDSDVERALAQWDHRASSEMAETGSNSREGGRPSNYGPVAGEWLESDLHQCSSGDKDRARSLVDRYKAAGAVEVYIGGIVRSGPIQIAGELIVELPSDPGQRKSVLAEHRRVLDAAFGGFANDSDPGGPVLRVTI
jgi:hypothetical protein